MGIVDRIKATVNMVGSGTPAYRELLRLYALLMTERDQGKLKAAIPDLERLEDDTHRQAQAD